MQRSSLKRRIEYLGTPMANEYYVWLDAESSAAADFPVEGLFIITASLFRLRPWPNHSRPGDARSGLDAVQ